MSQLTSFELVLLLHCVSTFTATFHFSYIDNNCTFIDILYLHSFILVLQLLHNNPSGYLRFHLIYHYTIITLLQFLPFIKSDYGALKEKQHCFSHT